MVNYSKVIQEANSSSDPSSLGTANIGLSMTGLGYLHYPYIVMGTFNVAVALLFLMLFCLQALKKNLTQLDKNNKSEEAKMDTAPIVSSRQRLLIIAFYFIFFFFNGGLEITYGGLIVMYAYRSLNMSKTASTLVNAAFWGSLSFGRLLGLGVSHLGYIRLNIGLCVGLGILAMVGLVSLATIHFMVIWVCSVVLGLAMACTLGNMLTVAKQDLKATGFIISVLMFALYFGMMLVPAATGRMFKYWGVSVFPYVCLSCMCLIGIAFVGTVVLRNMFKGT